MKSFLFIAFRCHSLFKAAAAAVLSLFFPLPNFPFMFPGHQSGSDSCVCRCSLGFPVSPPLCRLWGERGFRTRLSDWSPSSHLFHLHSAQNKTHTKPQRVAVMLLAGLLSRRLRSGVALICYSATNTWWHCGVMALEGEARDWGRRLSHHLTLVYPLLLFLLSPQVTLKGQSVVV